MYSGQGQSAYTPPPQLRLDVISEAWKLFTQKMGVWVGGSAIVLGISIAIQILSQGIGFALGLAGKGSDSSSIIAGLVGGLLGFISSIAEFGILVGMCRMAMKQIRGQEISVSDIFRPAAGWGAIAVAALLYSLGVGAGCVFCLVPGLLLLGLWLFTPVILGEEKVDGVEALRRSFEMLKGQMWLALGVGLVLHIVSGLGVIGCGVGYLFTFPLLPLSIALMYRDFAPETATPETSSQTPPTILGGER